MKRIVIMLLLVFISLPSMADESNPLTVEKFVGYEGAWFTADGGSGLTVPVGQTIAYRLVVTNPSETDTLTGLTLTDSLYPLADCEIPAELAAGQTFECVIDAVTPAEAGLTVNVALATAIATDGTVLTATDSAILTSQAVEGTPIRVEGVIESIAGNIVVVGGVAYTIPEDDPILPLLQVGDAVVIIGVQAEDGTVTVFLITLLDEDVYIDTDEDDDEDDDDNFRDDAPCQANPPDWAPAYGWRMKCDPDSLDNFVLPPGQAKKLGRDNDDDGEIDAESDANPGRGNGRGNGNGNGNNNGGGNGKGNGKGNGNGNGNGNGKNK